MSGRRTGTKPGPARVPDRDGRPLRVPGQARAQRNRSADDLWLSRTRCGGRERPMAYVILMGTAKLIASGTAKVITPGTAKVIAALMLFTCTYAQASKARAATVPASARCAAGGVAHGSTEDDDGPIAGAGAAAPIGHRDAGERAPADCSEVSEGRACLALPRHRIDPRPLRAVFCYASSYEGAPSGDGIRL